MKLLVLGGTRFVGRAVASSAVAAGWCVTTFNRGISGPDVHGAHAVRGDRNRPDDLETLVRHGPWDAVVDTTSYVPRETLGLAELLHQFVHQYVLLSTVSVYPDWPAIPLSETSTVLACPADAGPDSGPDDVEDGPTRYGHLKSGCEAAVLETFGPSRSTVLRPGVILGPGEYVGRLPWWLRRVAAGGRVLAPGDPTRSIQPVDVRDLADFVVKLVADRSQGCFNLAAPIGRDTFGDLLKFCAAATRSTPDLIWVPDRRLLELGVRQWSELPMWRTFDGVWKVDATHARVAGLNCRPLRATVTDTWTWMGQDNEISDDERSAEIGLSSAREEELLALVG